MADQSNMAHEECSLRFTKVIQEVKQTSGGGISRITEFLNDLDPWLQKIVIRSPVDGHDDAIKMAISMKNVKLLTILMNKLDNTLQNYLSCNNILELAVGSYNNDLFRTVLDALRRLGQNPNLDSMSEISTQKLYEHSWSSSTIKLLYDHRDSYFIPRGQEMAKMYGLVYYNTFKKSKHQDPREGAETEAEYIIDGLKTVGCSVPEPLVDWKCNEMKNNLSKHIKNIKKQCSCLMIAIMSHGVKGVVLDKNSQSLKLNEILELLDGLEDHIPVVLLVQACQGKQKPNQGVKLMFDAVRRGKRDAAPVEGSSIIESEILLKRANTILVMATPQGHQAYRHHFMYHMKEQLKLSDGNTSFSTVIERCSNSMSKDSNHMVGAQAPHSQHLLRKTLILPKAVNAIDVSQQSTQPHHPPHSDHSTTQICHQCHQGLDTRPKTNTRTPTCRQDVPQTPGLFRSLAILVVDGVKEVTEGVKADVKNFFDRKKTKKK